MGPTLQHPVGEPFTAHHPLSYPFNSPEINIGLRVDVRSESDNTFHHESPTYGWNDDGQTWIKFWKYGRRPSECPLSFEQEPDLVDLLHSPRTKTLAAFLADVGVPRRYGKGVQIVSRRFDGTWEAGEVFIWGVNDGARPISSTLLGRGVRGDEVWLCSFSEQ